MSNYGNPKELIYTPGGMGVNLQPNIAVSIGTSASSSFQPGLLYCGVGGDVAVVPSGQTASVLFKNIPDGTFLPVFINAIVARTTADYLVMCY